MSAVPTGAPAVTPQMAPASYDLAIYAGDSYQWQFNLWTDSTKTTPIDLTGATVMAQIRDQPTPTGVIIVSFTTSITLPNQIFLTLTAALSAQAANGVWDLQVTSSTGWVSTFVGGKVTVTPDVTE